MSKNQTRARTRPSTPITPATDGRRAGVAGGPAVKPHSTARDAKWDVHRMIAALALGLLLLLTLLGPGSTNPPNPESFFTPRIDGSGSIATTLGSGGERAIFPYLPFIERAQNNLSASWPSIEVVLKFDPDDQLVRRALVGQIYARSDGSINQTISDTGLDANPGPETLAAIELAYRGLTEGENPGRGVNGLAAMQLLRSLTTTGVERREQEDQAIRTFSQAIDASPETWQFTYNWSLANLAVGNYADAREGFSRIVNSAEADLNLLPSFWAGLAALRNGDPGEAISILTQVVEREPEPGGNDEYRELFRRASALAREALGDAYWANRDPARANQIYFDTLRLGTNNTSNGPYSKWLRLGLEQRAYERLAGDLATLASENPEMNSDARVHHDRGRLLTMLGRSDEGLLAYGRAASVGENDPAILVSHGQALESRGDLNGALVKAQEAITRLGFDPTSADLTSVARVASAGTGASSEDREAAQQLLDANLLRARVFGRQGNYDGVRTLASNIIAAAGQLPDEQGGLLHLYAAFAYEAAGIVGEASVNYTEAWDRLKGGAPVVSVSADQKPGRAAALAGLARTNAQLDNDPRVGIAVLEQNGYDPVQIRQNIANDPDAPEVIYQGSLLLSQSGQQREAANALRVATITRNLQDASIMSGIGRPLWTNNGTLVPADMTLQAADAQRAVAEGTDNNRFASMRYKQAFGLSPALAPAWNNLGVLYAERGLADRARVYMGGAGTVSPTYAWGLHNLAAFAYKQGPGGFFTAEAAQGDAIKASGAGSLHWGYDLRYDERGQLPTSAAPATDLMTRIPALFILALLLLHTLVGRDRVVNKALVPGEGPISKLANSVDASVSGVAPGIFTAKRGSAGLLRSLLVPTLVGMLALAWGASRGSFEVALVFLPVALLCALVSFGANEAAQYLAARGAGRETLHNNWPTGVLLGLVSIPFGAPYGWQITTRLTPAPAQRGDGRGRAHASDGHEGEYAEEMEHSVVPSGVGRLGLAGGSRILFAGLLANLGLAALFGLVYWLTGWPSMRLALFASALVLAFTSVSEAPADGWPLHRRNPALWLAVFVVAATLVVLLAGGFI